MSLYCDWLLVEFTDKIVNRTPFPLGDVTVFWQDASIVSDEVLLVVIGEVFVNF